MRCAVARLITWHEGEVATLTLLPAGDVCVLVAGCDNRIPCIAVSFVRNSVEDLRQRRVGVDDCLYNGGLLISVVPCSSHVLLVLMEQVVRSTNARVQAADESVADVFEQSRFISTAV